MCAWVRTVRGMLRFMEFHTSVAGWPGRRTEALPATLLVDCFSNLLLPFCVCYLHIHTNRYRK